MRVELGIQRVVTLAALLVVPLVPCSAEPQTLEVVQPPDLQPPMIQAPAVPPGPPAGKGRIVLSIDGNRRWCTFPDDRVMRPPTRPPGPPGRAGGRDRKEIFTFGYQFIVAAVKRGSADVPLVLYESPLYRTASWRPAAKVSPQPAVGSRVGQVVAQEGTPAPPRARRVTPDTLVPFWHEVNRCATLPGQMEFDLDPGIYDLYVAFDLLNREGGWVHRSTAYRTDIPVEAGARTRVEGRVHMAGGNEREVELEPAVPGPPAVPAAGATGP